MKKLKIGVVVDQLLAGGVQLAAVEQVRQLRKRGHDAVLIILMRKQYGRDFSYLVNEIPFFFLSDHYPKLFRKTIKFPIFSFLSTLHLLSPFLAPRVFKKKQFDLFLSLGTTTCLTTQAIYRACHIPYIAVVHDPIEYILTTAYSKTFLKFLFPLFKPIARLLEHSFVQDAIDTIVISRVHFNYLRSQYHIKPTILPLATDYPRHIPNKRGKIILSFGRWQKEKNPQFLLRLIQKIPNSKLTIAGNWINQEDFLHFKKQVQNEKLTDRVVLMTHFDEHQLNKLCKSARLFIHPHFEAFGLAALEAAAHGLPIIIPQKSGVTELFTHGKEGFFPKNVTTEEYLPYLEKLLSDEHRAREMGSAARRKVIADYSWPTHGKHLEKMIVRSLQKYAQPKIVVIETGHVVNTVLAGGDKLMEPMALRLKNRFQFTVVTAQFGLMHWIKSLVHPKLYALPKNIFDSSSQPLAIFLTYMIRIAQTCITLAQLRLEKIVYSSTNILPDIFPGFFIKIRHPKTIWIARIHHLIPPPSQRKGNSIVNAVAFSMQWFSLELIKLKADVIIALNEGLRKELEFLKFPQSRLYTLGAGIDYQTISKTHVSYPQKFTGIFLGRLHVAKGIYDVVPIWSKVIKKMPSAQLAVIGSGDNVTRQKLIAQIQQYRLTSHIHLMGNLPDATVYALMKNSKVFLFTDHEAGWGIAAAEAMACGLPSIGYDIGVLGTVYKHGFIKVPLSNYDYFAKAIMILLKNTKKYERLQRSAKKEAAGLDWKYTTKNFNALLQNILKQKSQQELITKIDQISSRKQFIHSYLSKVH